MILSKQTIHQIESKSVQGPLETYFDLPEKVVQFGTGVLLRGLTDYFIDKANKQGIFNGRIVVVKSTDAGDATGFGNQDNLYTICVKGLEDGKKGRARQARSPGNAAARPCHTSLGLPSALRDLEATYEFIEADSSESAAAWFNKLPEAVYSLQQYPLATK